jgi:hypothetical protein
LSILLHSCLAVDALIVCVIGPLYFSPPSFVQSCTKIA